MNIVDELPDYLKNAFENLLTPEQAFILHTKYGININKCFSVDDIADELGISISRVHNQEVYALLKLRHYLSLMNKN